MYETLLGEAQNEHIDVYEFPFRGKTHGLYWDRAIYICRDATSAEKACILAEKLGIIILQLETFKISPSCGVENRKIGPP